MKTLPAPEITRLIMAGHAVCVQPRKGTVRVDGFKVYKITGLGIRAAEAARAAKAAEAAKYDLS